MPSSTLIIIPTYNEKENIKSLVDRIFEYAGDVDLLIVDDDSNDGTVKIAEKIAEKDKRVTLIQRKEKRGRGYAGVEAFREALKRKDIFYIIEMDADFSHDPVYIPRFLEEIKKNDIVIGSRFVKGGKDKERNFVRNFISKLCNLFIKGYLALKINDCSSGYRCFKRRVISSLDLDRIISRGPAFIEETLYMLNIRGFRIKEMPIDFKARYKGRTKLGFIKLCRVFTDILFFKGLHSLKDNSKKIGEMREFGFKFALGLNILGCIMFYRDKGHFIWFTGIGGLSLIFAILCPTVLSPLKKVLDDIILWFGRLVSAASLLAIFYLVFAPIGLLLRVLRKDMLNEKIDKSTASYWMHKEKVEFSRESYERMG